MRALIALTVAFAAARVASALTIDHPGYTDAYYYANVAAILAAGGGLAADFVWNFIEAPSFAPLPVPSHRFWVPLPSLLQAGGIAALGPLVGELRAAQIAVVAVAVAIPPVAYAAGRSLGAPANVALAGAVVAGLGGAFAPAWVSLDSFAPAAVLGGSFFLAYGRAAGGDRRMGALAGLCNGALFLARAETALFGLALLALVLRSRSRSAGLIGAAVALAIGLGWLARSLSLGSTGELLARSALLVRYEDFFALAAPSLAAYLAAWPAVAAAKAGALGSNLLTLLLASSFVLAPAIAVGILAARDRASVRAYAGLAALVYLTQSLVWTLHSTHGSYFHSLAPFAPYAAALAAIGARRLLAGRAAGAQRVAAAASLTGLAVLSAFSLYQWHAAFDPPRLSRAAALAVMPPGPFLAIDAAAWRWISGRQVLVMPAEGIDAAACVAAAYGARILVLEPAHFSAYADAYRAAETAGLVPLATSGAVRIFEVRAPCAVPLPR